MPACPSAFEEQGIGETTFNHDRIECIANICNRRSQRHQGGMNALLNSVLGAICNAEELELVAQGMRIADISQCNVLDPFNVHIVEGNFGTECQRGQNGQLVRCIKAADVKRRVCFCIAELLRFTQDILEVTALKFHFGEDEVAGAVQDSEYP